MMRDKCGVNCEYFDGGKNLCTCAIYAPFDVKVGDACAFNENLEEEADKIEEMEKCKFKVGCNVVYKRYNVTFLMGSDKKEKTISIMAESEEAARIRMPQDNVVLRIEEAK